MDFFELVRYLSKKAKLFVLYWRRIIFAKDHFKVPLLTKLKANIFGGYLGDQWMLYDLDMKKRKEYLSEFDWYRSRYINITLRDPKTKRFKVFFAVQRIGTSQTIPVDNGSQGGLVCNIDLETGRLSHGRRLHDREVYEVHPDSGTRFADVVIPDWAAFKEEILALAQRFPYLHFIAWDVIKMPDGKNCVIEANTSSGVNIVQLWGGQRHGELGDFYRAHGVIK